MLQSQILTHYDLLPESYKKEADDFIELQMAKNLIVEMVSVV
jgi:hypothetical protein